MNPQEIMSKKWNTLFEKADQIRIQYIKEQCPICKDMDLKDFSECNHIELDFLEMNRRIDKELKSETRKTLVQHISMFD